MIYKNDHAVLKNVSKESRCKQGFFAVGAHREHKVISDYYLEMEYKSLDGHVKMQKAPHLVYMCVPIQ